MSEDSDDAPIRAPKDPDRSKALTEDNKRLRERVRDEEFVRTRQRRLMKMAAAMAVFTGSSASKQSIAEYAGISTATIEDADKLADEALEAYPDVANPDDVESIQRRMRYALQGLIETFVERAPLMPVQNLAYAIGSLTKGIEVLSKLDAEQGAVGSDVRGAQIVVGVVGSDGQPLRLVEPDEPDDLGDSNEDVA